MRFTSDNANAPVPVNDNKYTSPLSDEVPNNKNVLLSPSKVTERPWCQKCGKARALTNTGYGCRLCSPTPLQGMLPWDHPRRCQAIRRSTGKPFCRRWSVKGRKYCYKHNGRKKIGPALSQGSRQFVSRFYKDSLGPTLTSYLKQINKSSPKELVDLREEVSIARNAAGVYVEGYSLVKEWLHNNEEIYKSTEGKTKEQIEEHQNVLQAVRKKHIVLADQVIDAMERVGVMCEKAATIYSKYAETFDIEQLQLFVNQFVRTMYQVCGDENVKIAEKLEKEIHSNLRLPSTSTTVSGSNLKVDELLSNMALTLPTAQPSLLQLAESLETK